jgi:hypothetical protein
MLEQEDAKQSLNIWKNAMAEYILILRSWLWRWMALEKMKIWREKRESGGSRERSDK